MPDSLIEDLEKDVVCEELFDCVYGLPAVDEDCFGALVESENGLTVDQLADRLGCGRTTAHRAVTRLLDAGFVERDQVNYDAGGYYYVYRADDPDAIADAMQRVLNDWYAQTGQLIREFRRKYNRLAAEPATANG